MHYVARKFTYGMSVGIKWLLYFSFQPICLVIKANTTSVDTNLTMAIIYGRYITSHLVIMRL